MIMQIRLLSVVFICTHAFFRAVFDSRSSFVLCSETARKRLLRRLPECGMGSEDRLSQRNTEEGDFRY